MIVTFVREILLRWLENSGNFFEMHRNMVTEYVVLTLMLTIRSSPGE